VKIGIRCVQILEELANLFERFDERHVTRFMAQLLRAQRIFLLAAGRSRRMAETFAARLTQLEIKAQMVGDSTTGRAGAGDVILAVSRTGRTPSVIAIAKRGVGDGAKLLAVTTSRRTPLARMAKAVIRLPADGGKQYGGTLFEQAFLILADAIVMDLQEKAGLTDADLDKGHTNLE